MKVPNERCEMMNKTYACQVTGNVTGQDCFCWWNVLTLSYLFYIEHGKVRGAPTFYLTGTIDCTKCAGNQSNHCFIIGGPEMSPQ